MKKTIYLLILTLALVSCNSNDENIQDKYEFITEYTASVTVGGFVGKIDRAFKVGEIYEGTAQGNSIVRIRIAEHSELNDDCPNSWCYQELLDVPEEFLKLVE